MENFDYPINFQSDSDDELLEDILQRARKQKNIRRRPDYLNELSEEEFKARFRLSKNAARQVLDEVIEEIEHPTNRNHSLPPMAQFLLTLCYYATGNMLICLGDFCGVDKSTASRVVKRVREALAHLRPRYVKFPDTHNQFLEIQHRFYELATFPRVVGAIDCNHVKIRSPGGENAEDFRCRKGFFSINVQAVCTASLKIIDIVARWPGATHDQTIFNNSLLKALFEMGQFGNNLLIGDSGYAATGYLMTPITEPQTAAERLYNESLVRTRNTVERCFGVWKRRFPVLQLGIRIRIDRALSVIIACAVLHNIAIQNGEDVPPIDQNIQEMIDAQLAAEAENNNQNGGADVPVLNTIVQYFHNRLHQL